MAILIPFVGASFLVAALALAVLAMFLGIWGARRGDAALARSGRRALYATGLMVVGASAMLILGLVTNDFQLAYVTSHSDRQLPLALKVSGFWGGQEGSLLYWTLILLLIGSVSVGVAARTDPQLTAYAQSTLSAIAVFLLVVLVFVATPFSLLAIVPRNGLGLDPVLQNSGMLIHPPFELAGYSSFAIPFSFAVASLIAGRQGGSWIMLSRRVALVSWGLQSTGLLLGMWWSYHVLGWGGYYSWDPVENAALMPWLAATAYLHSIQVQEHRGRLQSWNLFLAMLSFLLSMLGTYIVRSGILPSVHTFAISPIGPWFFGFLVVCVVFSLGLALLRGHTIPTSRPMAQTVSREGAFLFQNVLFVILVAAILWGTLLPLLSGAVGQELEVGSAYYDRTIAIPVVALLALIAVGPLLPWQPGGGRWMRRLSWPAAGALVALVACLLLGIRSVGLIAGVTLAGGGLATCLREYVSGASRARRLRGAWPAAVVRLIARDRSRYGAYLAHVGFLAIVIGIVGSHFGQVHQSFTLQPGQTGHIGGYSMTYLGRFREPQGDHEALIGRLRLNSGEVVEPAVLTYPASSGENVSQVVIRSTPLEDLYIVLVGGTGARGASFSVFVNPLVPWIWFGGVLLILGVVFGNSARLHTQPALDGEASLRMVIDP
ncbi:MAG TPA: cytochrome c-type biogenesis CcmF C-terminal domain-containing protein [Candidatus Dormibacteraeota bacterium]|jgi:cytochrome c-type biogenesis protein CcmF|nr:cytochrome c-type biogenesis CcmF C-terminal domain-containing protein [Candidatus Dormibacteraeota bacterium]